MAKTVATVKGKLITINNTQVGPAHDPYARTTMEAQAGHENLKLVMCALTGTSLEINGVLKPTRMYQGREPIAEFERLLGCTLDDIHAAEDEMYDDPMGHPSQHE